MDIKKLLIASTSFLLGYAYCMISQYIIPAVIDNTTISATLGDTVSGVIWIGTIISWILALLVIPIALYVNALTTDEGTSNMAGVSIAIAWSLISMIALYVSYFWTTGLTSVITYDILTILFWVGYIAYWAMNILVIPGYTIINAKRG